MNTDIFELYQGLKPIYRVYLGDEMVWAKWDFLPPYIELLGSNFTGDEFPTKLKLVVPYAAVDYGGPDTTIDNGVMGLDTELLNRIVEEVCDFNDLQTVINTLHTYLVNGDFVDGPIIDADNNAASLTLETIDADNNEQVYAITDNHVIDAEAKLTSHDGESKVYTDSSLSIVDSRAVVYRHDSIAWAAMYVDTSVTVGHGRIAHHKLDNPIHITTSQSALSATGRITRHQFVCLIDLGAIHTITDAVGKIVKHKRDNGVQVKTLQQFTDGVGRIVRHKRENGVQVKTLQQFTEAVARLIRYTKDILLAVLNEQTAVSANGIVSDHDAMVAISAEESNTAVDAVAKPAQSNHDLTIADTIDSNGTVGSSKSGAWDGSITAYFRQIASTLTELTLARLDGEFDDQIGGVDSDNHLDRFVVETIDFDADGCAESTVDNNLSALTIENLAIDTYGDAYVEDVNVTKCIVEPMDINTVAAVMLDTTQLLSTLFWLFPEKTESNLYIPQIYDDGVIVGAVQNGAELAM